jgi:hypothetical protein
VFLLPQMPLIATSLALQVDTGYDITWTMDSHLQFEVRRAACAIVLLMMLGCSGNGSSGDAHSTSTDAAASGTVSVEARISTGTRFIVYCNDVWAEPQRLQVVPGEWKQYRFSVPQKLTSLRFDPSEAADGQAEIRSIRFDYPGQPQRSLPFSDLPKWLKYHAEVTVDAAGQQVRISATGTDMYIMSTVNVIYYPVAPK